jgi:hypothetical protein
MGGLGSGVDVEPFAASREATRRDAEEFCYGVRTLAPRDRELGQDV